MTAHEHRASVSDKTLDLHYMAKSMWTVCFSWFSRGPLVPLKRHFYCSRTQARPYQVLDLTKALVAEWEQIAAARFQNLAGLVEHGLE